MFDKFFFFIFCLVVVALLFPTCSKASPLQLRLDMRQVNHYEIREVGIRYKLPDLTLGIGYSNMGVSNYDYSLIRYNKVILFTADIGF
jgi:hypothetical protein